MNYKTVFEITDKGLYPILFVFLILLFVGVGVLWFTIRGNSEMKIPKIIFGSIFTVFALLMFLAELPSTVTTKSNTNKMYENREFQIVEGVVEKFHPMPYSGHEQESFIVNGVYFEYSDFLVHYAFNNTASHGGPIYKNGQQVRLSYINSGGVNKILKIELKQ